MASSPPLRRGVSNVGKAAVFGTPEEEVARILAHKQNYYVCLKVGHTRSPEWLGDRRTASS